jgi:hypothetical protein
MENYKTAIQSVIFVKPYSLYDRHAFLKRYKLKPIKRVNTKPNTFRYRIIEPTEFREITNKKIKATVRDGESSGVVNLILGIY